jgi:fructose-1,6-bisphosphatase/inositol monophosphatase family enzyme
MSGFTAGHLLGQQAAGLTIEVSRAMEDAAAQALLPRFRKLAPDEREEKSAGEVVTIADRECEILLSGALARLLPEASIVGEEAVHAEPALAERLGDDLCWVVDPLDGTAYFAAGQEPFGVMVALASKGTAIGGWILEPLKGRFCWAAAGQGSWIDNRRIAVRTDGTSGTVGLSPLLQVRAERFKAVVEKLQGSFSLSDIPRCAAAHYPAMLLGSPDLTLFERTLPWDHAAGALLIEEAGGRVARLDGRPYRLDDDDVGLLAALSPAQWEQAASLLTDLPE